MKEKLTKELLRRAGRSLALTSPAFETSFAPRRDLGLRGNLAAAYRKPPQGDHHRVGTAQNRLIPIKLGTYVGNLAAVFLQAPVEQTKRALPARQPFLKKRLDHKTFASRCRSLRELLQWVRQALPREESLVCVGTSPPPTESLRRATATIPPMPKTGLSPSKSKRM